MYFYSISKYANEVVEYLVKKGLVDLFDCRDKDGNSGLIIAAIYSNINIAKFFLKIDQEIIDIKNKSDLDALTISVYNNDNLMFFLLINNFNGLILNIDQMWKLAIRNENLDIINYLINKNISVVYVL